MSRSSSRISSDERWRSSIRGPRSRGPRSRSARVARRPARSKPGGDHRHADLVGQRVVDHGAEDDVGVAVGRRVDDLGRLVDLEQAEVLAAGDVEQDAAGALDRLLQQRRRHRGLGRLGGARLAGRGPDAHQRRAGVLHDRAHVGEVEVDQAGDRDQVGDALDALAQHVVGLAERVEDARAALDDRAAAARSGSRSACRPSRAGGRCPPAPGARAARPRTRTGG